MKTSHTPGPWTVETHKTNPRHFFKVETGKRVICDAFGHHKEDYANARLIAAAPEMLELLKHIETFAEDFATDSAAQCPLKMKGILTLARAGITKATGGTESALATPATAGNEHA